MTNKSHLQQLLKKPIVEADAQILCRFYINFILSKKNTTEYLLQYPPHKPWIFVTVFRKFHFIPWFIYSFIIIRCEESFNHRTQNKYDNHTQTRRHNVRVLWRVCWYDESRVGWITKLGSYLYSDSLCSITSWHITWQRLEQIFVQMSSVRILFEPILDGNVDHFTSHNITPTSISSVTSFLLYSFFQDEALSYSSEIISTTNHFDSEDTGRSVSWPW